MKRWISILLCIMLIGTMSLSAFAATINVGEEGGMDINAQVPLTHIISVVNEDGGAEVIFDGKIGDSFTVERLSEPEIIIRAKSGYAVKSVMLGETDITDKLLNGKYTFESVYEEKTLTVVTEAVSVESVKTYTVRGSVTKNGNPASGVTLELRSELKTAVTDADGAFKFDEVESGHHSLTAIIDGEVVGYTEFEIKDGSVEFDINVNDKGVTEINLPDDTATVNITLDLTDDGELNIEGVEAEKAPKAPSSSLLPQTGGENNLFVWITVLAISFAIIVALVALTHKKRESAVE